MESARFEYGQGVNFFDVAAGLQQERQAQRARTAHKVQLILLAWLALVLAIAGSICFGLSFQTEHTETAGALWWKTEKTTAVPTSTTVTLRLAGLALLALATGCAAIIIVARRRATSQKRYLYILNGIDKIGIADVASKTDLSGARVARDIQRMINSGTLSRYYIDHGRQQIVSRVSTPVASRRTVVVCSACHDANDVLVGIVTNCQSCGSVLPLGV